uniref:Secreted protein n=1 Tax=Ascaris lumbricoides TaxID=6252 RepID=A0A0M3HKS8_ASCLU
MFPLTLFVILPYLFSIVSCSSLGFQVLDIMQRVPQLVSGMTGVDIFKVTFHSL